MVNAPRAWAKVGLVFLELVVATAIALIAVVLRWGALQGPAAEVTSGMHAFGNRVLGVAVVSLPALTQRVGALLAATRRAVLVRAELRCSGYWLDSGPRPPAHGRIKPQADGYFWRMGVSASCP